MMVGFGQQAGFGLGHLACHLITWHHENIVEVGSDYPARDNNTSNDASNGKSPIAHIDLSKRELQQPRLFSGVSCSLCDRTSAAGNPSA